MKISDLGGVLLWSIVQPPTLQVGRCFPGKYFYNRFELNSEESLGSESNDGNVNATNNGFDWLDEKNYRAARAARLLGQHFDAVCQMTT